MTFIYERISKTIHVSRVCTKINNNRNIDINSRKANHFIFIAKSNLFHFSFWIVRSNFKFPQTFQRSNNGKIHQELLRFQVSGY